jgi:hypothetical protein
MGNFVQATEYDAHLYAKLKVLPFLCIFVIKYSNIWFVKILYMAMMHTIEFGQSYCNDLLKTITRKFILYFSEFYFIFYEFCNLKWISLIWKRILEKG